MAWLRSIYVSPHGRLLATTSTSRFHPHGLAALLRAREQGICASSWCDAPVRHLDHVTPFVEGGPTSLDNGQGLCARCNHAKQSPGWRQKTTQVDGRDAVETVTPTGHTYVFVAPAPPVPVRAGRPAPHHGTAPTGGAVPVRDKAAVRDAPVHPEAAVTGPAGPVRDQASAPEPLAAPAWTPAVGMSGPSAGRTPRSRYQIGCHTNPRNGPIAYRSGRRPGSGPRPRPQPRAPRRVDTADLSWAHRP
ncbi:HNH endonuclease [Promicromonospora sp. NPDC090134]|uniref:HNH endonuclease n=1 Tax=Promicromonospora sp. NPDC090134 TaxID=3364408 RepID=UPI00382BECCD